MLSCRQQRLQLMFNTMGLDMQTLLVPHTVSALQEQLEEAQKAAAAAADAAAGSQPATPASAKLQATYRVCVHTSAEPAHAGTCRPVWLELVGSRGTTGPIELDQQGRPTCFAAGSSDIFRLEAPEVGELQQLNIWVDADGTAVGKREVPHAIANILAL